MSTRSNRPVLKTEGYDEVRFSADLKVCAARLKAGSRSFSLASKLLPVELRGPVAALYAFCRVSDDVVDDGAAPDRVKGLHDRLDKIYQLRPQDDPVDRAFTAVVHGYNIPRSILNLLLEGFDWDVKGRLYETLEDTASYGVRVASTVGVMMCLLMNRRGDETLARAADLGVAMQLTNIARDVGEDAANGRLYLPTQWLEEEGIDVEAFMAKPRFSEAMGRVVRRLLEAADVHYARAEAGIGHLPWRARAAIRAAALIYQSIGAVIAERGYDSVSGRAVTTKGRKIKLALRALAAIFWRPGPKQLTAEPIQPLLDAAARSASSVEFIMPLSAELLSSNAPPEASP